jgi:HEAT repeat protein
MPLSIVEIEKHFLLQAAGGRLDPSNPQDIPAIVEQLTAPDAVRWLAIKGHGAAVMGLIKALPPEWQAAILAAPEAVLGLAKDGQVAAVMGLIEALPPESQEAILAAPNAVSGLAHYGQGAAVQKLKAALNKDRDGQKPSVNPAPAP